MNCLVLRFAFVRYEYHGGFIFVFSLLFQMFIIHNFDLFEFNKIGMEAEF